MFAGFAESEAATKRKQKSSNTVENKRYAAIVVDAQTGEVLMAKYADSIRHPASVTKIMTLYMLFEALQNGRLRLSDKIQISSHAAKMSPSKLGLPVGSSIKVEDAIKAVVTKSANDIAAAIGEKLAGSERNFAARMTRKAHDIGMSRTVYRNASGLPDPQQVTTARDQAKLAMAMLRDFPQYYHYFGIRNFEYKGRVHRNHNRMLGEYRGLDGIKTGYINASGFNLVASAKQNGRRLVGVVFGGTSWRSRNDHMAKLLDEGFAELSTRSPAIMEASNRTGTSPVPLPPPMQDDVMAMRTDNAADDSTDEEEDVAYTANDSQKLASMIDAAQIQQQAMPQQGVVPSIETTRAAPLQRQATNDVRADVMPTRKPPVPEQRVALLNVDPSSIGKKSYAENKAATHPASAARTVMQLRIPRSQLPAGIPQSQIVRSPYEQQASANDTSGGWSIQVGAFQSRAMTDQALRTAQSRLPAHLQNVQPIIVPQSTGGGIVFKGRLHGYTALQAAAACAHLSACLVVSPGS